MSESLDTAHSQGELSDGELETSWYPDHWGYSNGHGWTVYDVGKIMPVCYEGECLPNILVYDERSYMWMNQMMNMKIMSQPQMRVIRMMITDYLNPYGWQYLDNLSF